MNHLKQVEMEAEKSGQKMTSIDLAEQIGMLKSEQAYSQARLRGLQKAMKLRLNTHPEYTK